MNLLLKVTGQVGEQTSSWVPFLSVPSPCYSFYCGIGMLLSDFMITYFQPEGTGKQWNYVHIWEFQVYKTVLLWWINWGLICTQPGALSRNPIKWGSMCAHLTSYGITKNLSEATYSWSQNKVTPRAGNKVKHLQCLRHKHLEGGGCF